MPTITKEEYARRVIEFIEAHKEDYTDREIDFIKRHASWGLGKPYVADILRQIYNEVGAMDDDINMYQGFINLLECHDVASGPVSASPSPTTQATIKLGLSITAPYA